VFAETLNTSLLETLDRPDLRIVANEGRIVFEPLLDTPFRADPGGEVVLGATCLGPARVRAFHLRHALELSMLLDAGTRLTADGRIAPPDLPVLAGLCAARVAACFWLLDAASPEEGAAAEPAAWLAVMAADAPPERAVLEQVWAHVRHLQGPAYRRLRTRQEGGEEPGVPDTVLKRLHAAWPFLAPAEMLMASGGDARLAVDPATGLNHYGCSHRPRPWAITFASSTASSLSERGFGGAEAARRRLAAALLDGRGPDALRAEGEAARAAIAAHYRLAGTGAEVVLAPSGTDCELIALATAALPEDAATGISNILLAPDETGSGVPLAAAARHFASDTARGAQVAKGTPIDGFPADIRVVDVPIRDADGRMLSADAVDAACAARVREEAAQGRLVLLHRLDLSKTGLLAPSMGCIAALERQLGDRLLVVVDACQARLDARRVAADVARGWMVMITGSKFFTGPPFCGAVLLPPALAAGLRGRKGLPGGLRAYGGRHDWPPNAVVAEALGEDPNAGMILRWHAAMAEMQAFAAVPDAVARDRAARFLQGTDEAIAACPDLLPVPVPPPARDRLPGDAFDGWDMLQTIRSVLVLSPGPAPRRPLAVAEARCVYRWLNADISPVLQRGADDAERALGRLLCHIGQPAPVAHDALAGEPAGALRISVGARLLSGEPSHDGLDAQARLEREIADVRRVVAKISLILQHWDALLALDPVPRFSIEATERRRADPGLNI